MSRSPSDRRSVDLGGVLRRFFPRRSAKWVNSGRCFAWALAAYDENRRLRPRLCTVSGWGGHAFVQIGFLFYDAGFPTGVEDWRDLWEGGGRPRLGAFQHQTRSRFIAYWQRHGRDHRVARRLRRGT